MLFNLLFNKLQKLLFNPGKLKPNKFFKIILLLCAILPMSIFSQELSTSLRNKIIETNSDTIKIDTLSIVPGSLFIYTNNGLSVPGKDYKVNYSKSELILKNNSNAEFSGKITLKYRVLPINLSANYFNKDSSMIISNFYVKRQNQEKTDVPVEGFIEDDKLEKNGSISRGLSFGNQRDMSSLSNLNLQLSGKLNDEVSILAAISDNNMPIQPEGNTQQIQEFDKIYIQMFTKKSGIKLGDIELNKPAGYFLSLKKQTRGLQMYSEFNPGKSKKMFLKSDLSVGMAKGKYSRLKIQGIEGNQGPYRLQGANNETYIIVLSGSEKVYIDGNLLVRGEKFDYVIDYNSGEITFTSNRPITKDSRITVEFEYAQQVYPRLQSLQTNILEGKKATFYFNFFGEKDNKNDPLSENYDENTKSFLASIGDSIQLGYAGGVKKVEFENNKILYQLADTLASGQYFDTIYKYSTNPQLAVYQLNFLYVGKNMGNYNPVVNNANGKVYEWIAPKNNVRQGDYEPVIIYITPQKSTMANIGGSFKTGEFGKSGFELALSNYDKNTYSSINNGDDMGYAFKFNIEQGLYRLDTNNIKLNIFANYQMSDKKFKPIENYNDVEFERDWNLTTQTGNFQEQRLSGGLDFRKKNLGFINLTSGYLIRENQYSGMNSMVASILKFDGFELESNVSFLKTDDPFNKSDYLKHKLILSKHFKYITIGTSEESEDNKMNTKVADSLLNSSFKFSEYSVFIHQPDSSVNQYFANYKYRQDYLPDNNLMTKYSTANTFQAGLNLLKNKVIKSKTLITFRNLQFSDTSAIENKGEENLSGRQEITAQFANGALNFSFFYETASGLELKKEYLYIEVQKGQGQYTWIDYNQNNIKELDEFEIAKFADQADHIRLFLPGINYVRAYTTQLNQSIIIQPDRIWNKKTGIKRFLSSFSDQFAFRIMQKANNPDFLPDLNDNINLISSLQLIRNNLSFKSKNRKWQTDYLFENNVNKSLLVNGIDRRGAEVQSLKLRWKMIDYITFYNTSLYGKQSYNSEYFTFKNYLIHIKSNETSIQFQPAEQFFTSLLYRHTLKQNTISIENARLNELKLNVNQVFSSKINIQADFSYVQTIYNAESSTSVAYEMLEGLKPGMNLIWNVGYNHKLSKLFQLSILYNGRSAKQSQTIHNGSVQLRANF